jgi:ATP-dependent DNA helicase RecQ
LLARDTNLIGPKLVSNKRGCASRNDCCDGTCEVLKKLVDSRHIHWQHPASIEDYLQEFGRAGRDGKASVAVLLHDRSNAKRDIGLLQFMANRAVGNAQLSAAAAQAASGRKVQQIDRMANLATSRGCFRDALVRYFTGPERTARKSFSTWLLELVFADRGVAQQEVICCDACQQRLIGRYGQLAFVEKVLGA